jgi:HSP20 family protein
MAKESEQHKSSEQQRPEQHQPTVRSHPDRGRDVARWDPRETSGLATGPFGFMRRMMDEMDRMFEDLGFGGFSSVGAPQAGARSFMPRVDVQRRGDALVVRADLPGVRQEDVEVEIESDALVLRGERREEHREGEGRSHRTEVSYGSFMRTVPLPEGADPDKATANFANGVLEVTIPTQQRRGRRIEVASAPKGSTGGATTH